MNKKNKNKGFSLIELIIAIAILVILTGLLAPQFMKYIEKSREAKDMQTLDTVYSSVQAALANEGAYDAIIKDTKTKPVKIELSDVLTKENPTDSFVIEMQSLMGTTAPSLKSKKAADGSIYIAISYTNSTVSVKVDDGKGGQKDETRDIFGGFEIMVYSSKDGATLETNGLDYIGANLKSDLAGADSRKAK